MRKVIVFNMITVDGFFAGPNGEIDWHNVDEEFNDFAIEQLKSADGLIFGRTTYQLMVDYWPTPAAINDDRIVAELMNSISKYVFSRTLAKADWNNTRLIKENVVEELSKLKQQPGKDLYIFGSADLTHTFVQADLVDEYRLIVSPIVLGRGKPMFTGLEKPLHLSLLKTRTFRSGNVLLYYQPVR